MCPPAYCSESSAYDIYCQSCIEHGRTPPTWFEFFQDHPYIPTLQLAGITKPRDRNQDDTDFDVETEQRDGWCYAESRS
jgi:hypothetical protein